MKLEHKFVVPAPVEEAWAAFNDLERVVPCFPGATLTSYEGDDFTGSVKVKLGPISLQYTGNGTFVERDAAAYSAVIEAKGKDRRGNGSAIAKVTTHLTASGAASTEVTVDTDLTITGRPAQFGRGLMQDVSNRLLDEFTACLVTKLQTPKPPPASAAAGSTTEPTAASTAGSASSAGPGTAAEPPTSPAAAPAGDGQAAVNVGSPDEAASPDRPAPPADSGSRTGVGPEPQGTIPEGQAGAKPEAEGARSATEGANPETETVAEASLNLGSALFPVLARRARPYVIGAIIALILRRLLRRP